MVRRLWAFVLALLVAGASAAPTLCQVTCNVHDMHATAGHGHQHPDTSSSRPAATMRSSTPACDHQFDGNLAIQQALRSPEAPSDVAAQVFTGPPAGDVTLVSRSNAINKSPPGLLALTAQLRV